MLDGHSAMEKIRQGRGEMASSVWSGTCSV